MPVTSAGASATLTFTTVGTARAMSRHSSGILYAVWLPLPALALIGLGIGSGPSRRKKLWGCLLLWCLLATLIVLPACGTSGNAGTGGTPSAGTPAGTYTITITGKDANNLTQSNPAPTVSVVVD